MSHPSISQLLAQFTARFNEALVDSPRLCAELILCECLGLSRAGLLAFSERRVSFEQHELCEALAKRRTQGEPLAYILGRKEFYGLDFKVNAAVLIPRPETELLVDLVKQSFASQNPLCFADLGTGSACLLSTILKERPSYQGLGVDLSRAALQVAAQNILAHNLQSRSLLVQANFAHLPLKSGSFSFIVSNPPYIASKEYYALNKEVRLFEPELALHSGELGLDHPCQVIKAASSLLVPKGYLFMEIGSSQGELLLAELLPKYWEQGKIIKDLAGRNRVLVACRAN